MRKGGRNASGIEPMRFDRFMLGSSERRIWASSAAIAACFSPASRKIIDFVVFGKHHLNLLVILNEGKRRVRREER